MNVMETIRTFIAIELNDDLRRALARTQAQFQRERAAQAVRWVAPASIHLTLKFLGDTPVAQIPALTDALRAACVGVAPFTLTLAGAGAFPNTRKPNVVWIGVTGQAHVAAQLARQIEDACAALGLAREARPFTPHLTLGRLKRDAAPTERRAVGEEIERAHIATLGMLRVERVSLMQSDLRPTGSVYTQVAAVELG